MVWSHFLQSSSIPGQNTNSTFLPRFLDLFSHDFIFLNLVCCVWLRLGYRCASPHFLFVKLCQIACCSVCLKALDPLPSLLIKDCLEEAELIECKQIIYRVVAMEHRNEALPTTASVLRGKGAKRLAIVRS